MVSCRELLSKHGPQISAGGKWAPSRESRHSWQRKRDFMKLTILPISLTALLAVVAPAEVRGEAKKEIIILHTPAGIRFGVPGEKPARPAPTLFVFATGVEDTLASEDFNKAGRLLAAKGWLSVALDLPCHGKDTKPKEPAGLDGWRHRLEHGDNVVSKFVTKASAVLDYLIKEGYTDPKQVAACGTSRGGFIALHFAAAEPRVKCVAAFAPVTDLLALREFHGMGKHAGTRSLAIINHADKLAGRSIWLCIGNNDERVDTDKAIAFTRKVVAEAVARKKPAPVDLHVMATEGHRVHATAHEEAARWILEQMGQEGR